MYSVEDARHLARRTLPRVVFDYIDGGAEDEVTMDANYQAFRDIFFRPKMAVRMPRPRIATTVLGTPLRLPILLAPCGLVRVMHPDGAVGIARAAVASGTVSILSSVAGTPPEELSGIAGSRWFQLYAADRDAAGRLMDRAVASGFGCLMVTVDTPALGKRERDLHNGVTPPLRLDARSAVRLGYQVLAKPRWALNMAGAGVKFKRRSMQLPAGTSNGAEGVHDAGGADSLRGQRRLASISGSLSPAGRVVMEASAFSWDDIAWIRSRWTGSLVVKGVLSATDAVLAVESGADCVVVSNHGGRQLEGAPATMRVLPEVVAAVGGKVEVLVDSGVRRGADVVKAIALGARAVLIGRPYLYGLAAGGQHGVEGILNIFREEMERTMTLLGCPGVDALDSTWLQSGR
ncbi:MAG: alpha-hydroxy-acid oxidizing protein [Actinobacteria bacterium]|nr:alpha-hydroxy-acid oxidizing protein [Actinomycetota bacterium]MCL5447209.1 alpha-hydroxy-acid oxidizing protein [Actinomycetota bacterium]